MFSNLVAEAAKSFLTAIREPLFRVSSTAAGLPAAAKNFFLNGALTMPAQIRQLWRYLNQQHSASLLLALLV